MKVAIVSPYPPSKGTLNEYCWHLVSHLNNKDEITSIDLISDEIDSTCEELPDHPGKVQLHRVWKFNDAGAGMAILKAVKKSKADIVLFNIHFMSFGDKKVPAALGLFAPLMCRLAGFKTMVLMHNIVETVDLKSAGFGDNRLLHFAFRMIASALTRVLLSANLMSVTISKYVEILREKYKVSNVVLIPHGSFDTPPEPDFGSKEDIARIMTFGKFGTYKKVEVLIEAVEIVRNRLNTPIELMIAGTDSPNKLGYLADVQERYAHVPDVEFTGYVEEEDVPTVFQESTVVVFPYTSTTGSSGVLHQAGSYGKACVLPKMGDLQMLIEEEGYTGQYFEPDNAEDLADAIEHLLTHQDERISQARQNYAAAAALPMSDIADWYVAHFKELLGERYHARTSKTSTGVETQNNAARMTYA